MSRSEKVDHMPHGVQALKSLLSISSSNSPPPSNLGPLVQPTSTTSTKAISTPNLNPTVDKKRSKRKQSPPIPKPTSSSVSSPARVKPPVSSSAKSGKKSANPASNLQPSKQPPPPPAQKTTPPAKFAGSAFTNSPDPFSIPLPDFDFDDEDDYTPLPPPAVASPVVETREHGPAKSSPSSSGAGQVSIEGSKKTVLLRNILNVKPSLA